MAWGSAGLVGCTTLGGLGERCPFVGLEGELVLCGVLEGGGVWSLVRLSLLVGRVVEVVVVF